MTDSEIIKALECSPLDDIGGCRKIDALSLINRQKAEIDHFRKHTKKVKANLKYYLDTNEENGVVWIPAFAIDNIVKEMTEDEGK